MQAMAYAMVYPEPAKLKRKSEVNSVNNDKSFVVLVSHARAVLRHSEALAQQVMKGTISLGDAGGTDA